MVSLEVISALSVFLAIDSNIYGYEGAYKPLHRFSDLDDTERQISINFL